MKMHVEPANQKCVPRCTRRVCGDTRMSSTNSAKVEEEGQNPNVSPRELVLACTFVVELCEMRV